MAGSNNGPGHNYLSRRAVIKHLRLSISSRLSPHFSSSAIGIPPVVGFVLV